MKSFLGACAAALILAVCAWAVLEQVQTPSSKAFATTGARI
jgi:hypothetical protein